MFERERVNVSFHERMEPRWRSVIATSIQQLKNTLFFLTARMLHDTERH